MAKLCVKFNVITRLFVMLSITASTSFARKEELLAVNFTCTGIGMHTCQNNRCIYNRWFCDGEDDCRTGEDEDPLLCNRNNHVHSSHSKQDAKTKHRNQRELTNRKLVVTTILEEPYMMMKERGAFLAGNDRFQGYLSDILQKLATSVGFKYETRLSRDGKYGELGPDGSWNGMIGEVQSGEADIAAGALIVTDTLRQYVNFTEPFLSMRWSALLRRPLNDDNSAQLSRGSASAGNRRQSSAPAVSGGSRRLSTAAQLLRSDITCGVVENSVAHQMLAMTSDPVGQALYQRMMAQSASSSSSSSSSSSHRGTGSTSPDPFVRSVQEGIDRAQRERYAFVLDSPTAEYVASREPCDLYTVEPFLDVATYAFAVRRRRHHHVTSHNGDDDDENRLLRQAIDREMRRMKQSGEMQSMYLRWWRDECSKSVNDEPGPSRRHHQQQQPVSATSYGDLSRRHARVSIPSSSPSTCADFILPRTLLTITLLALLVMSSARESLVSRFDTDLGKL